MFSERLIDDVEKTQEREPKNIFVHVDFKKLREAVRQLKKDEQALAINLINFKSREKSFQNKDWSVEDRSSFIQEKYTLLKLKFSS